MATQGTWTIPGINYTIPDFHITEALTGGAWGGTALNNPNVQSVPGIYQSPYQASNVLGTSTQNFTPQNTSYGPTPGATGAIPSNNGGGGNGGGQQGPAGDSPLRALEKIGWENMNPSQRSDYLKMIGQNQQQPQGVSADELNQIYAPGFAAADQQLANLQAAQPGEEKKIQDQFAAGMGTVDTQQQQAQQQLTKQTTSSDQATASALANARQLYNELSQKYGSMFGSRTSAGPFAMELLGRETQKQFGNVGQAAEQSRQAIADQVTNLGTWVNTQKNSWTQKRDSALTDLQTQFRNQIANINAQRGALESQKAQDRYTALQDARNKQDAINAADKDFQQRLALFQAQTQAGFSNPSAYTVDTTPLPSQTMRAFNPSQPGQVGPQQTANNFVGSSTKYYIDTAGNKRDSQTNQIIG